MLGPRYLIGALKEPIHRPDHRVLDPQPLRDLGSGLLHAGESVDHLAIVDLQTAQLEAGDPGVEVVGTKGSAGDEEGALHLGQGALKVAGAVQRLGQGVAAARDQGALGAERGLPDAQSLFVQRDGGEWIGVLSGERPGHVEGFGLEHGVGAGGLEAEVGTGCEGAAGLQVADIGHAPSELELGVGDPAGIGGGFGGLACGAGQGEGLGWGSTSPGELGVGEGDEYIVGCGVDEERASPGGFAGGQGDQGVGDAMERGLGGQLAQGGAGLARLPQGDASADQPGAGVQIFGLFEELECGGFGDAGLAIEQVGGDDVGAHSQPDQSPA